MTRTGDEWLDFMAHAAATPSMADLYTASTGCTAPPLRQDHDRDTLANPSGHLADYLHWVTISQWGTDGVPEDFIAAAKERWPHVSPPRFPV